MTHEEALRKVQACLRLAKQGGTPEESAAAAAAAQRIIDKFKLNVSDLEFDKQEKERDDEEVKDFSGDPLDDVKGSYSAFWCGRLALALATMNQCKVYYGWSTKFAKGKSVQIFGRPSDVQVVRYLYGYFKSEVIRLADGACKGNSQAYRVQFCTGVVDTINRILREKQLETRQEARKENEANPLALVRVNNSIAKIDQRMKVTEEQFAKKFPKLGRSRGGGFKSNQDGARAHGQREGANVRFTSSRGALGAGRKELGV